MPDQLTATDFVSLAVVVLSTGLAVALYFNGALRERALDLGPTRDLGVPRGGYLIGASLATLYVLLNVGLGGLGNTTAQAAVQLLPLALIGLLIGRAMHTPAGFRSIGLMPRWPKRDCAWGLAAGPVSFGLAGLAAVVMQLILWAFGIQADDVAHEALRELRENFSAELLLQLIISAVVLAPIIEEILFRGILQTSLMQLLGQRRWPAVVIAAALFALTHWWVVDLHSLPSLFVLGLVFGYLYERTGSLLTPILAHAVFNAINIAISVAQIQAAA